MRKHGFALVLIGVFTVVGALVLWNFERVHNMAENLANEVANGKVQPRDIPSKVDFLLNHKVRSYLPENWYYRRIGFTAGALEFLRKDAILLDIIRRITFYPQYCEGEKLLMHEYKGNWGNIGRPMRLMDLFKEYEKYKDSVGPWSVRHHKGLRPLQNTAFNNYKMMLRNCLVMIKYNRFDDCKQGRDILKKAQSYLKQVNKLRPDRENQRELSMDDFEEYPYLIEFTVGTTCILEKAKEKKSKK